MDYKGSVAQQNVNITTDIVQTAVVGGNFYQNVLYVTNRFSDFGDDAPEYPVVTKDDYADVIGNYAYLADIEKKIVKSNLASLFEYGSKVKVYIVPNTELSNFKYKGYFTYLDVEWLTAAADGASEHTLSNNGGTLLQYYKDNAVDKAFTKLITDIPVDPLKVKGVSATKTKATVALVNAYSLNIAAFARPAMSPAEDAGTVNAYLDAESNVIGGSPALYELGRCLGFLNDSGTPVGNAFDMDAVTLANVLPNGETDPSELEGVSAVFAAAFEDMHLNYFKPVGNGTGQITNFGGWTLLNTCIGAEWMVAYMNFMNRVACATIMTSGGRAVKNAKTYGSLLEAIKGTAAAMEKSGRLTDFTLSAPAFGALPKTNGHSIVIPNAWTGVYLDNVRDVDISGSITVAG